MYSVGFTGEGLFGASTDARRVAEDIARIWNSETNMSAMNLILTYTNDEEQEQYWDPLSAS